MYDLLVNAGALTCSIVTGGDNNLLHWFCYKNENDNHIELLNKILDQGCNIDAINSENRTPLMIAAKKNMSETCRILLKNRAAIDKRDSNGHQAIDLSIPGSQCSKLLLKQASLQYVKSTPSNDSNSKIVWRKRIETTRRATTELINTDTDETNSQGISSKYSEDEEEQTNESIDSDQRRESEPKHEQVTIETYKKLPKRRVLKNIYKRRSQSVEARVRYST